jgi:hypothetical protein
VTTDKQTGAVVTLDDQEWRDGIRQRECSCRVNGAGALMKRSEYQQHFKDGTHNERMKSSAPKEGPANGK